MATAWYSTVYVPPSVQREWERIDYELERLLVDEFHAAGLFLPEESKVCRWCHKRFGLADPNAICPKCVEATDPNPADERRYWLKTGREWTDPEPQYAPDGGRPTMT